VKKTLPTMKIIEAETGKDDPTNQSLFVEVSVDSEDRVP
jgi:hypothetical protein